MKFSAIIVDDEDDVRAAAVSALERAAARYGDELDARQAKTALGAMNQVHDRRVDFAVLDYELRGGTSGIELAVRLLARQDNLAICVFSGEDATRVEAALREAVANIPHSIQYKTKPVNDAEWLNFYDFARKEILRQQNEFLFDDLQRLYWQAASYYERLTFLNLIGERAVRIAASLLGNRSSVRMSSFVDEHRTNSFIGASAIYNLADELAGTILEAIPVETKNEDECMFRYLATRVKTKLLNSARFVLALADESKHRTASREAELQHLLREKQARVDALLEFVADLRMISFFRRIVDSEFCIEFLIFDQSGAKVRKLEFTEHPNTLFSGAIIGTTFIGLSPLMVLEKCRVCKRFHPFHLISADVDAAYFGSSCSGERKRVSMPVAVTATA